MGVMASVMSRGSARMGTCHGGPAWDCYLMPTLSTDRPRQE